ncbi:MAG: hypothetical protein JNK82_28290 [Myxococcaceae bacterium]|nr:hypothetical protein [Myxococcaceae bacterium]
MSSPDLVVIHEHPLWQQPLFDALTRRGVRYEAFDLKKAAFADDAKPKAKLYFNQASPSAYLRGNTRAVPLCLAYLRALELGGARVLNGSRAFSLELSKSAQAGLMHQLGVACPRSIVFNDFDALVAGAKDFPFPALLKPEQGGSGARISKVENFDDVKKAIAADPNIWLPDGLLLLQQYFPHDFTKGIVRMEFLGGKLLYAMRVVSHGRFNLCPAPVCNPDAGGDASVCHVPTVEEKPVEFYPYPEVPAEAVEAGRRVFEAGGLDVGGIEYLEAQDGRRIFYDVNANSNLRPSVAKAFGFDPFERVVDYLVSQLEQPAPVARAAERAAYSRPNA